jgi:hypothetical protein
MNYPNTGVDRDYPNHLNPPPMIPRLLRDRDDDRDYERYRGLGLIPAPIAEELSRTRLLQQFQRLNDDIARGSWVNAPVDQVLVPEPAPVSTAKYTKFTIQLED